MSLNQYTSLNLNGHLAFNNYVSITGTGVQNNVITLDYSYIKFTGNNVILTGLNPGSTTNDNKILDIVYLGDTTLQILNNNSQSSSDYRIRLSNNENITLEKNDSITLIYDSDNKYWSVLSLYINRSPYTNEPTGFPVSSNGEIDRTSSVISFNNSLRQFTIAPASGNYKILIKGQVYYKTTSETITIDNITGIYYIYFNESGTLTYTNNFDLEIIYKNVYVATVYWNSSQGKVVHFGDERHGCTMDGHTHARLHQKDGAVFITGSGLNNFVIDGDGTSNTHTQFSISSGEIKDEDILHILSSINSTTGIPVLYRIGTDWNSVENANQKFHYNTRAYYNLNTGGSYSLAEVDNNKYCLYHIVASNDKTYPYFSMMGLNQYETKPAAREGALTEISQYTGLPFVEFVFIATIIFESKDIYTNTGKSRIVSTDTGGNYVDWRFVKTLNPFTSSINIHNNLGGLQGGGVGNYYHSNQPINSTDNVNFNSITSPTIISNNVSISGTLRSNESILNNLNVTGSTILSNTNITGTTTLNNTSITGTLTTNNVNISQNLNVTGTTNLTNTNMSNGNITSNLNVTGTTNLTNTNLTNGNVSQNLNVTGTSTFTNINLNNANISSNLNVTGTTNLSTVNSTNQNISQNLNVTGTSNLSTTNVSGTLTTTNINVSSTGNINNLSATGITTNTLKVSNINYPVFDGTNGQAIVTDGSGNLTFQTVSGGGGGSSSVSTTFVSTNIYPIGSPIYYSASGWNLAIASSEISSVQYVISDISGSGTFTYTAISIGEITLTTGQWDVITGSTGGLITGSTYYLSSTMPGKISRSSGLLYAPVLRALSSIKAFISLSINNIESGTGDTFYRDTFTTVASTTAITLTYPPAGKAYTWLSIDGVIQSSVDFNLSGNTLTLGGTVPSGTLIDIIYARSVLLADTSAINKMIAFSETVTGSSKTSFNLTATPSGLNSCIVFVGGAIQDTSKFNINGNVLIMSDPVPVGVQVIAYVLNSSGVFNSLDSFVTRQTYNISATGIVNISTIFGSQVSGSYRFFDINDPRISGTIYLKHNGIGIDPDVRVDSNSSTVSITQNTSSKLNIYIASSILTFQNNTSNTISLRIYREI